jgi:hypothetical protein
MASLLIEIQQEAINGQKPLADVLRKLFVLAYKINSDEIKDWVEGELNGYSDESQLPDYRAAKRFQIKGHFRSNYGHEVRNADIPFSAFGDRDTREFWSHVPFVSPISVMEGTVRRSGEYDTLRRPIGSGVAMKHLSGFYKNMQCVQAWNVIPVAYYLGIIEQVRNKVLKFALELLANKDAMAIELDTVQISESTKTVIVNTFNTTIMGDAHNLAQSSSEFTQKNQAIENDTI